MVGRGPWGVETLFAIATLKLAAPQRIHVIRGNHETESVARIDGFQNEWDHKVVQREGPSYNTSLSALRLALARGSQGGQL